MKKLIFCFISLIIILSCFTCTAFAESNDMVSGGHIAESAGQTVTVPVYYTNREGIYVAKVTADYDESVLEYVEIENTAADKFGYTVSDKDGVLTVLMDGKGISNVKGDLTLFEVYFKIKDGAKAGTYSIALSGDASRIVEADGGIDVEGIVPDYQSGSVTVICKEHKFTVDTDNGKKCENCDAVQNTQGEVTVGVTDTATGNDITVTPGKVTTVTPSSQVTSGDETPDSSHNGSADNENDGDEGVNTGHLIPLIAAAVIAVGIIVTLILIKKKK